MLSQQAPVFVRFKFSCTKLFLVIVKSGKYNKVQVYIAFITTGNP